MKKTVVVICMSLLIFHMGILKSHAQQAGIAYGHPYKPIRHGAILNLRAYRNFTRDFSNAQNEVWDEKPDGFRVNFTDDQIRCMVDFDKRGNWISTIRNYDETKLSTQITYAVKTAFLGYYIVWVTELKVRYATVYFVKIEGKDSLKTIRVINDQLDVVEDYSK